MNQQNFDFSQTLEFAVKKAFEERGHVNILIAGRTGVGKSTLINSVFQGKFADTGQGRPVSTKIREINKKGVPLSIFDTRGLELEKFSEILQELKEFVQKRRQEVDIKKHLHVAWICIDEGSRRVQEAEEHLVEMLSDYMPVIAVVTKATSDKGFKTTVQDLLPKVKNVIRVRAIEEEFDDGHVIPPMGLDNLVELTTEVVPEGLQRAFIAAQKVNIQAKKNKSHGIVVGAASSAAAIAAVPIPFSDAVAIVPIQVGMLAGITATFGLSFDKSFLTALIGSVVTGAGGTLAGRTVVSGLLKLIPGAGSAVGGMIAATTAAALTTAFGEVYIATLALLFEKNNGEPPTQEDVLKAFQKQYSMIRKTKE